jgi:hypothetical protein
MRHAGLSTIWLAFIALLALAWVVYLPGLSGGFLFDDWANLPALGAYGPVDDLVTFWRYITSGGADFTGRPIALASFLLDAQDWPTDAYPFKRDSVILHLVNSVLLLLLLRSLGRVAVRRDQHGAEASSKLARIDIAAVLGAGMWLLHPFFVSTTLYAVQREAMLPATFILLGLIGYTRGRTRLVEGKPRGIAIATTSIVFCTILAFFCKANGALLPLLAWVLEAFYLHEREPLRLGEGAWKFRWMKLIALKVPAILVIGTLIAIGVHGFMQGAPVERDWSIGQRLMTEARVVVDYLHLLWIPRPFSNGLFNDSVVVSRGFLSPPSTLICIAILVAVAGLVITLRHRFPVLVVSVLFFFFAHLIESTVVPLELYFEHRNYVPALLLFWPLGHWLSGAWVGNEGILILVRRVLSVGIPLLLASLTMLRASLWGNVTDQAGVWAEKNPDSPRAQTFAARSAIRLGHPNVAIERIEALLTRHPVDTQAAAALIDAQCSIGTVDLRSIRLMRDALESDRQVGLAFAWLSDKLDRLGSGSRSCAGLDVTVVESLIDSYAITLRHIRGRLAEVHHLRGRVQLVKGDGPAALEEFDVALKTLPSTAKALQQSSLLAVAGYPALAIEHLKKCSPSCGDLPEWGKGMRAVHARLLVHDGYWATEIAQMRNMLEKESTRLRHASDLRPTTTRELERYQTMVNDQKPSSD